jgi:hypothetical protein
MCHEKRRKPMPEMMTTSMTPTEKNRWYEARIERLRRVAKQAQGGTEEFFERTSGAALAITGGAATGFIWSKFGNGLPGSARIGDTSIEIDTLCGVLALAAAAFGMAGKHSAEVAAFGGGMLSARTAAFVGKALEEHEQAKATKP